jgi:hypothetical protein
MLMRDGIITYLTLGEHALKVQLKFFLALFMGDGKSSDVLCCRMTHYKQPRTSRACYTAFHDLVKLRTSTSVNCHWVLQEEQSLPLVGCEDVGKEDDDSLYKNLQAVSTVRCDSPMFRMAVHLMASSLHVQLI